METLKEVGISGMVQKYVAGYGLSTKDEADLVEYFSNWEILRQCCGQQMSAKWRNEMMPAKFRRKDLPRHPTCATYDIDSIEQAFMKTDLYILLESYPNMHPINKPSLNDDNLNGTYCSQYNHLVRTKGLSLWGVEGGRPTRSKLDGAIKQEFKLGIANLRPEGLPLLQNKGMREIWRLPEEEKKAWLKAVLAAREGGKSYSDYKIEAVASRDEGIVVNDDHDQVDGNDNEVGANIQLSERELKKTHAIFLISFGKEAAESTLVERCILSLRRRGAWSGYVVVLTDAPADRYQNEWDGNVIIMHPLEEHFNGEDGVPLTYTAENKSLKPKRFKTFILEYIDSDIRLDSVEIIYYLDIDIMAGNALSKLFQGIENKYGVLQPNEKSGVERLSRVYFFTPLSKEWPLQGGTFILERKTSQHCLDLWRREIDGLTRTGRGRDQDALATINKRIESGQETKCQLVRMENENYVSFPTARTFGKVSQKDYPNLIHISNSVFAKRINEEAQNQYITEVLQLSEEEKRSGKYGKAIVHAKDRL